MAAGIAIGMPLALAASRGARSLVYGVGVADPRTLLGAALVVFAVGAVAALVPSRRALNVDPLTALRAE